MRTTILNRFVNPCPVIEGVMSDVWCGVVINMLIDDLGSIVVEFPAWVLYSASELSGRVIVGWIKGVADVLVDAIFGALSSIIVDHVNARVLAAVMTAFECGVSVSFEDPILLC